MFCLNSYRSESRCGGAAFVVLAIALVGAAAMTAGLAWLSTAWKLKRDIDARVWAPASPSEKPKYARCVFSGVTKSMLPAHVTHDARARQHQRCAGHTSARPEYAAKAVSSVQPTAGEAITHRCPRCEALVNGMCIVDELSGNWLPIVKEASPEQFLDALDPTIGGQKGRMLLDEAMANSVDCMRCKASMCCIACALDLRCCKVRLAFCSTRR